VKQGYKYRIELYADVVAESEVDAAHDLLSLLRRTMTGPKRMGATWRINAVQKIEEEA
jgi:hypothetical protein